MAPAAWLSSRMLLPISFDILSTGTTGLTEQTYHNPPFFCKAKQLARSDEEEKDDPCKI